MKIRSISFPHPLLQRPFWGLLCLIGFWTSCSHSDRVESVVHRFAVDTLCAYTPPLNQGNTSTCWAYSVASLLESGWLRQHPEDTLRLSVMYVVRQKYLSQFDAYYYSQGREEIRNGGLGHSFLRMLDEEGIVPLDVYRGHRPEARRHDHRKLLKKLKKLARQAVKERNLPLYRQRAIALLDEEMGTVPDTFLYKGVSYTPRSFADSLHLSAAGYVELTNFSHHPFDAPFVLEVPDNWEHVPYLNLPLDELERVVRQALADGETVVWHGDVSEVTFSMRNGMALWHEHPVTQELRQHYWEQFETTDDHMMHMIGLAHDESGHPYYILKNSYGRYGPYKGLLYMSEDYFRAKTVSVLLSSPMHHYSWP